MGSPLAQIPLFDLARMSFKVRRATDEDRGIIEATLREYHADTDSTRRYEWLYLSNPHGRALTWLAFDEASGEFAGMTSFFLRRLTVDGGEALGALGGDGFVRPAFRRRGLGRMLHAASRAEMAREGLTVMFGTPMPANVTPLTQVGARTIAEAVRYARPLRVGRHLPTDFDRLLRRLIRPRVRSARLEAITAGDRRVDAVWDQTRGELGIATVRDANFYDWRFLQSPTQSQKAFIVVDGGRPIAACALERLENRLRIVDLVAPRANWGRAFGPIATFAPGCALLEIKLLKEDGEARSMWRHGFFPRDSKPLNLLLPPGEPRAPVLYDPRRWFFTWAESDMDHG